MGKIGYLVEYISTTGEKQRGIIHRDEQTVEFKSLNKCLVRLVNDDSTIKLDEKGNQIKVLKSSDLLNVIGYVD